MTLEAATSVPSIRVDALLVVFQQSQSGGGWTTSVPVVTLLDVIVTVPLPTNRCTVLQVFQQQRLEW